MTMPGIARTLLILGTLLSISCSTSPPYIENVHEFNLTRTGYGGMSSGLSRSQTAYILYGEMSRKQRENKLGQYYTIHWEDTFPHSTIDLVFEYQRAGHGSRIFSQKINYPANRSGGEITAEFSFTGEDYAASGRVMTWKATLLQDGKEVSRRTSYLWEDPQ